MNFRKILTASLLAASIALPSAAQQPYSGCWFLNEVLDWTPDSDPDAKFNRSRVPMAERFTEPELMKYHPDQTYVGTVETATITTKMCSLCPSQGDNHFLGYQPTYWQYLEKFVNWGGAANEGMFVLPPAYTIDAAHINGVKILGQLFLMPKGVGGRIEWVDMLLSKDANGKFPYAVKMYQIAKYYGFDGWFINNEINNGHREDEWAGFVSCFNAEADANGDTNMEIQWYDAGGMPTTTILKAHKNTSEFLEYGSITDKSSYADILGCTREDLFHRLYAGVECVKSGGTSFGGHELTSLAMFCPEQHTFKDFVDDMINAGNVTGSDAYAAQEKAFKLENEQWWQKANNAILERSVINAMPFSTTFSVGLGKYRFVNGEKLNTQDWHSSSVQGILPTWRYWIENQGTAQVSIDWDDAYNVGNSIKLSGTLAEGDSHLWRLFKTMVPVTNGSVLRLVYKANGVTPEVQLATASSVDPDITLSAPSVSNVNGWSVADYDLSSLNGKTIYLIGLNLKAAGACELKLGQLSMLPANYNPATIKVNDFIAESHANAISTDLRLTWSYDYNADFDHFDIYVTNANGRRLVGQTRGEGFYVPRFNRENGENNVKVELAAVMKDGNPKVVASEEIAYVNPSAPIITVTPVPAYAKVGEHVTLTVTGTDGADSFQWTLPSTVKLVSGNLSDATIVVEASATGSQNVEVKATNSYGTSTFSGVAFDCLTNVEYKEVANAAIGKSVSAPRSVVGSVDYLIDGDCKPSNHDLCWSDIATASYAIVDLKSPHTVYGFNVYDYRSGFPTNDQFNNVPNYRILVSEDGKEWHKVVEQVGTQKESVHSTTITPAKARYVKVQPYDDTRFTTRFFEFEVIGRDNSLLTVTTPGTIACEPETTIPVTIDYDLNGEAQESNFNLELSSESSYISFTDPECDGNGHFTFEVTTENRIGKAELFMTLTNGDARRQAMVEFVIDSKDAVNELKGMTAEMRKYKQDYATGGEYDSQETGNLTDGNTTAEGLTEEMYEDPCKYSNDLWAVFKNPQKFSLGKVKIYFVDGNKGYNVNDKEGFVNRGVSIRTSHDGVKWTTIETYNDLEAVNELTCYLPEIVPATYLAVVCDVNTNFYPSLAEVEAYTQFKDKGATYMPLEIASGFNYDIIAEKSPCDDYADMQFSSSSFYTSNVKAEGAIADPDNRNIVTDKGTSFTLGNYADKNALFMKSASNKYTLKLATPVAAEKLYLLCAKTYASIDDVTMTVTYDDNTTQSYVISDNDVTRSNQTSSSPDAFAINDLGVCSYSTFSSTKHGLVELNFTTDASKTITSITFANSRRLWIFGVTAYADPNPSKIVLSADSDELRIAPEATSEIIITYDMNGEDRSENFNLKAKTNGKSVKLGKIVENAKDHTFTVPVIATENLGKTQITFTLNNGERVKKLNFTARVDVPSEFSGWNEDVIVEALPATQYATGYVTGTKLSLFSTSVQEAGAISDDNRKVTTANGNEYMLAPYDENNALTLKGWNRRTLEAVTPEKCTAIRVLYISSRSEDVEIIVNYEDGTSTDPTNYTFSTGGNDIGAVTGIYRICSVNEKYGDYKESEIIKERYALNELEIPLDLTKKFKSISFEQTETRAYMNVLSLAKVPYEVSGIDNVFDGSQKEIKAYYNMQGMQVVNPSHGLFIVVYTDGSSSKIYLR